MSFCGVESVRRLDLHPIGMTIQNRQSGHIVSGTILHKRMQSLQKHEVLAMPLTRRYSEIVMAPNRMEIAPR
jgi:hypothetical protein